MSSREPMWYCHECNAEMRPLMVPDPHCASCNGTFVEKMDDPQNDPREFHTSGRLFEAGDLGGGDEVDPMEALLSTLFTGLAVPPRARSPRVSNGPGPGSGSGLTFHFSSGGSNGNTGTFTFGGPSTLGTPPSRSGGNVPNFSDYLNTHSQRGDSAQDAEGPTIPGQLMARYLASVLGRMGGHPLFGMMPEGDEGRMGDYVFTQDALDRILNQLMEGDSHHPVPATDEVVEKLQRDLLEEGSPLLEKDCAVCKEQFQLNTEDPDEQIVVTLPCHHPFHQGCILPWLKSSGTCPVCRYQLVPQPEQHGPGEGPSGSHSGSPRPRSPGSPGSRTGSPPGAGSGIFSSLFGNVSGGQASRGSGQQGSRFGASPGGSSGQHLPGEWEQPDLD